MRSDRQSDEAQAEQIATLEQRLRAIEAMLPKRDDHGGGAVAAGSWPLLPSPLAGEGAEQEGKRVRACPHSFRHRLPHWPLKTRRIRDVRADHLSAKFEAGACIPQ